MNQQYKFDLVLQRTHLEKSSMTFPKLIFVVLSHDLRKVHWEHHRNLIINLSEIRLNKLPYSCSGDWEAHDVPQLPLLNCHLVYDELLGESEHIFREVLFKSHVFKVLEINVSEQTVHFKSYFFWQGNLLQIE